MWDRKISGLLVLGGILGLTIAGFVGATLLDIMDDSSQTIPDPSTLPFEERWLFNATLDRTTYHLGENMVLTVQLTCLVDHNCTNYTPGWFRYLQILDNNNETVWRPIRIPPGLIFRIYEFHAGDELGGTDVFHLGTTKERPIPSAFDVDHWIPILPTGRYYFVVDLQLTGDGFHSAPSLWLPFTIKLVNKV